jgi:predicted DNA-binding protein
MAQDTDRVKRGRPREVDNPVRVSIRVPAEAYDRLDSIARRHGESVPEVIRRVISALQNRPAEP